MAARGTEHAVVVRGLRFAYPGAPLLLEDIDFTIRAGETVALLGLSGCGKTTLAQIICGVIPSLIPGTLSGDVSLFGVPLAGKSPAALAGLAALVFQDSDEQTICTTVEDELAFGLENIGMAAADIRARVEATLARYRFTELRLRDPAQLSGGEKKRLAVAAVSMLSPRLIALDEPLSGLDEAGRAQVADLLREMKAAGQTVIVVEHDLDAATASLADRWLVLAGGRIAAFDTPAALLRSRILYDLELRYDD